jgi:hydrogenase/urease accessory protein HupE
MTSTRLRTAFVAAAVAAIAAFPTTLEAHLVSTGMGPFYDGAAHLFLSPDDLLGVIALCLFAGLNGKPRGRTVLFALPGAWVLGGFIGLLQGVEVAAPAASALTIFALGLLLAANVALGSSLFFTITLAFGIFHGYLNGTAASAKMGVTGLTGIVMAIFALAALISSFAVSLRAHWMRIAVRVAGSWIAAFGLLMIGWAFRS